MIRRTWLLLGIAVVIPLATPHAATAQWSYPGFYGNYGWSQWGADPAAGYMAGLGAYARGQGDYTLKAAQADAIERDSLIKWNKALMAQRRQVRKEQAEKAAKQAVVDAERAREEAIKNGSTLNDQLEQVLELNPGGLRGSSANRPITIDAIKDIAVEPATEPISICIDQLSGEDALPFVLQRPEFAPQRAAVRAAVLAALQEDAKGTVSAATMDALTRSVIGFRDAFRKVIQDTDPGYFEADEYLRTLAGLSRLLHNPHFQRALAQLENFKDGTLADLIVFMQAFNLRFAPAASPRQVELYNRLSADFAQVVRESGPAPEPSGQPAQALRNASQGAFKGLTWTDLDSQAKPSR